MDIQNLVQVRNDISLVKTKTTTFYPHKNYRCICIDENNIKQYLVYGVVFDEKTFNELFIYSHSKIMNDFENIGLLSNGKPLSKKEFIELSDMHLYGRSRQNLRIVLFGKKDCLYGFYSYIRDNKKRTYNSVYEMYKAFVMGNMVPLDDDCIQFGNCGIPLTYNDLRVSANFEENIVKI